MTITLSVALELSTHLRVTPFPLADANGNCVTYLDNAGNIQAHYEYDAFGNTVSSDGDMDDDFRFRFSSKYLDDENGLAMYYYGYRYYAPSIGRWLSRDPIGERGGLLMYGFVGNHGVDRWDFLGFASCDQCNATLTDYLNNNTEHRNKILVLTNRNIPKDKVDGGEFKCVANVGCKCCNTPSDWGDGGSYGPNEYLDKYGVPYYVFEITICCSNSKTDPNQGSDDPVGVLYHEVQHAYEMCSSKFKKTENCQDLACSEARARFCSGMSEEEARNQAINSCRGHELCKGVSDDTINDFSKKCPLKKEDCYIIRPPSS